MVVLTHMLMCANNLSLGGGAIWRGYGNFQRDNLDRGSILPREGFDNLEPHPTSSHGLIKFTI